MPEKAPLTGTSSKKTASMSTHSDNELSFAEFKETVMRDYRIAVESREASILGRKEVLQGKAKFGIFGDGKEIAQVAMAKAFMPGDFRSGYYRDQTFMFAKNMLTVQQWFAGLYAHANLNAEPSSAGRQMGGHYSTRSINPDNNWANLTEQYNSSSDISPTGSQMPRLLGLAMASKQYRNTPALQKAEFEKFSKNGNEIAFGTIGDASTSEGMFWEAINAAGVMQVPMVVSVWDDGYGISVPIAYQTTKNSISEALKGMQRDKNSPGYEIIKVKGWDYPALCEAYEKAAQLCRKEHVPVLLHIEECTQPQGHSTSGSHERYKTTERLQWEKDFDGIKKMREWILKFAIATEDELSKIDEQAKNDVKDAKNRAWKEYLDEIKQDQSKALEVLQKFSAASAEKEQVEKITTELQKLKEPLRRDIVSAIKNVLRVTRNEKIAERDELLQLNNEFAIINQGIDVHTRKGSVPSCICIEGGNTNQSMHTIFSFQIPKNVISLYFQSHRLDACCFTILLIEFFHLIAALFSPHDIHAHKHIGPVLAFGSTRTGIDFQYSIQMIFFGAQHIAELQFLNMLHSILVIDFYLLFSSTFFFKKVIHNQ